MFQDHFSKQASAYAQFRPNYPDTLYEFILQQISSRSQAWDCGTGSGQVALRLANHFTQVYASDPSQAQLDNAAQHPNIAYQVAAEEAPFLPDHSLDLITVAQALHWFDLSRFGAEVSRTLRTGGIVAAWCYGLLRINSHIDPLIDTFYTEVIGGYWPPERRLVDQGYRGLRLPGTPLTTPELAIHYRWDLDHLINYIGTWSAVQRYRDQQQRDPLADLKTELVSIWRESDVHEIRWPIHLLANRL